MIVIAFTLDTSPPHQTPAGISAFVIGFFEASWLEYKLGRCIGWRLIIILFNHLTMRSKVNYTEPGSSCCCSSTYLVCYSSQFLRKTADRAIKAATSKKSDSCNEHCHKTQVQRFPALPPANFLCQQVQTQ